MAPISWFNIKMSPIKDSNVSDIRLTPVGHRDWHPFVILMLRNFENKSVV